jgi:ribosomal protein L37AE/L43A
MIIDLNSENSKKKKGKCLGYSDKECNECGRLRVEIYENGDRICEKCNWNETKQKFEKSYI